MPKDTPMAEQHRVRVIVNGTVQGVFFRLETRQAAQRYEVTGWVRNCRDGTVEAVFEGEAQAVEGMLAWCHRGPPHAVVKSVDVSREAYAGEFDAFTIKY